MLFQIIFTRGARWPALTKMSIEIQYFMLQTVFRQYAAWLP